MARRFNVFCCCCCCCFVFRLFVCLFVFFLAAKQIFCPKIWQEHSATIIDYENLIKPIIILLTLAKYKMIVTNSARYFITLYRAHATEIIPDYLGPLGTRIKKVSIEMLH